MLEVTLQPDTHHLRALFTIHWKTSETVSWAPVGVVDLGGPEIQNKMVY